MSLRAGAYAPAATPSTPLGADACAGLSATPKRLPSKYLYDALGSALFEAICRLPWYEVTRAEQRLLERYGASIGEAANPGVIVELGPGSGDKLATLVRPLAHARGGNSLHLHLIDISPAALDQATRTLGQLAHTRVTTSRATYEEGLRDLGRVRSPLASPWPGSQGSPLKPQPTASVASQFGRALVLFLGSNIGNFDPSDAEALLRSVRAALRPGDTLLLGLDLVKPEAALRLAYDDPLGVTAAFNRNLLVRLNRELGADFDLDRFAHQVRWNVEASRIEMHLASLGAQTVRIPGAACTIALADDETIWTESSYKYELRDAGRLGRMAGFRIREQWLDSAGSFALTLFEV